MARLPFSARVFLSSVIVAGAAVFAVCLPLATFHHPVLLVGLLALSAAAAAIKIQLPLSNGSSTVSISYAIDFAALLLVGPHETMFVAAVGAFSQCHVNAKEGQGPSRTLFSMASLVMSVQGAGLVFGWLGGTIGADAVSLIARPLLGAAMAYFLLNVTFVAIATALSTQASISGTWANNFFEDAPSYFLGAGTATFASAVVSHLGLWIAPFTFAPIYLTYRTYKVYIGRVEDEQRHIQQTSDLHLATIEALARAIDAKDQMTQMHIRRVQVYAAGLARAAGLSEGEVQGVKTAALLHDIGKLAVPEHILSKPGPLTHEEFQRIRIHPQVGAEIIAAVPFPYPVAPLIMSHHERWDGKGYPQGLKAEEIPVGARILTIVDYYDAVTTQRPYHSALSNESAIGLLRHEIGRALDPKLVPIFVDLLPQLASELSAEELAPVTTETADDVSPSAPARPAASWPTNAFENIALAHREIYALYEIAQSMGTSLGVSDTMALISSKLLKLVPWSGCALFLSQPDGTLTCRFAAGVEESAIMDTTIEMTGDPAEWVANGHRTVINVDPRTTFTVAGARLAMTHQSAILCPLYFNDAFIGCIALMHTEPDRYTEDHRRLLERIAEQAGPVINNSMVFEQTQEDSLTDPLTGLPNRRSMFVHLSRELARADRLKGEVALIVMDVDGFKTINDTYGHSVGDHALRAMSAALLDTLRPYDLCVRYAGDEFIVVLTDCSRQMADAKMRELQDRVAQIEIEVRAGKRMRLAASAGAAVFPHDGATYESLLADADQRMYRDKAMRRGHLARPPQPTPAEFHPAESFEAADRGPDETRQLNIA